MNPDITDEHWYTTDQLAELLGVDPSSVRRGAPHDAPQGPPFVRVSARHTIYAASDVEEWLRTQRVDPGAAA